MLLGVPTRYRRWRNYNKLYGEDDYSSTICLFLVSLFIFVAAEVILCEKKN